MHALLTRPYGNLTNATVFSEAHQQLAKEASEQAIVLLQNPGGMRGVTSVTHALLPLRRGLKLAIIGPSGNVSY